MSRKFKPSSPIDYQRGKVKISGDSPDAKRLMYIDLITSKLFWIAVFIASIYLGQRTQVFSTVYEIVIGFINGGRAGSG